MPVRRNMFIFLRLRKYGSKCECKFTFARFFAGEGSRRGGNVRHFMTYLIVSKRLVGNSERKINVNWDSHFENAKRYAGECGNAAGSWSLPCIHGSEEGGNFRQGGSGVDEVIGLSRVAGAAMGRTGVAFLRPPGVHTQLTTGW
jgi:hypothetical protein